MCIIHLWCCICLTSVWTGISFMLVLHVNCASAHQLASINTISRMHLSPWFHPSLIELGCNWLELWPISTLIMPARNSNRGVYFFLVFSVYESEPFIQFFTMSVLGVGGHCDIPSSQAPLQPHSSYVEIWFSSFST